VAALRIQATDESGNILNFYNEPFCIETEGPVEVIGPKIISLKGGMGGTYIKYKGQGRESSSKNNKFSGRRSTAEFYNRNQIKKVSR
jgi:hypothetical protein